MVAYKKEDENDGIIFFLFILIYLFTFYNNNKNILQYVSYSISKGIVIGLVVEEILQPVLYGKLTNVSLFFLGIKLNSGYDFPLIGYGTFNGEGAFDQVYKSSKYALECGYKHFDTAYICKF